MPDSAPEPAQTGSPILQCRNIEKHYGGVYALKAVDFDVRPGEVHALCGENGAGKSSLAKILAGVVPPDGGSLFVQGEQVSIDSPARARAFGIGIVFQELDLFEHLSVAENMTLAGAASGGFWLQRGAQEAFCLPYLKKVGLSVSPRAPLGDLSIASAQMVAIARALSMQARILLLDEPTSSLTEEAAERLLELILELKQSGTAIVYVSHKMKEIFRIADRVTVLRDGTHVSTKEARATSIEETIRLMVGREVDLTATLQTRPREEIALRVDGLSTRNLREISFTARCGEILGIAGLVGAGRSELGEALFGLQGWQAGEAECLGSAFHPRQPREALGGRFAYLPEDRRTQGLFLRSSVRHNASLAILPELSRAGWIHLRREKEVVAAELQRTRTKAARDTLPVNALSGGNQQKVLLAKWLLPRPKVLYLDDPTRGVDVGAKADIYRIMETLAESGCTILFVSSELTELLRYSHRIMVLWEGRCAGVVDTRSTSQEQIMTLAAGHPAS
jgi:ribose transport system ATP-binding protein